MPSLRSQFGKTGPRIAYRFTTGDTARANALSFACLLAIVLLGLPLQTMLFPKSASAQPLRSESDETATPVQTAQRDSTERAEREQLVRSGILLIVGIAILGGLLVIVTLLWGGSARRQARTPLPISPPRDELWYLRKKAATAGDAGDADSVQHVRGDHAADGEDEDDDSKQADSS